MNKSRRTLLLLLLVFRNPHGILLPLACVGLSLVWTFGLMAWTGIGLSILTMIVPVVLIAVGTAYCLHVVAEYGACAHRLPSRRNAVQSALETVSLPTVLAVSTTVVWCYSSGHKGIRIYERTLKGLVWMIILAFLIVIYSLPQSMPSCLIAV